MRRTLHTHALRRTAAATIAVLALGGLAACNDKDDSTATDDPSASSSASESTSAAPSESASESPTASTSDDASPTAGETVDPDAFVADVLGGLSDATTAHMTMKMAGGPAQMTMDGDIDYTKTPPEMAMTMDYAMLGGKVEMRLVDGVMYMQIPELGRGKWMKMPLTGKNSPLGDDLLDQMDPGSALKDMEGAVDAVTYVGDEDVDGESLHHYTMKVRSQAFRDLQSQLGGTGAANLPSVITYDLWTDADGLMHQTKLAMGDLGSVTMTLSNWGEPVDIQAPPPADVMKMPSGMSMGA